MKSSMTKYSELRFLIILAFIVAACTIAVAENGNEDLEKPPDSDPSLETEVLTTLEQRMQEKITIDVSDLPIDTVIRQLAEQADVDLIKSPKVMGNVTATLTDVPLEEALKNILRAHGFDYVTDKNMIRIVPAEDIVEAEERLASKIYRITYADVAEVQLALEKFVSKRGTVSLNKGTSHIIVTDTESNIKAIDTFIKEIDQITSQVLVEVRIYDITSQNRLDLGVQWEAGRNTDFSAGALGNNPSDHVFPFMSGAFRGPTSKTDDSTLGAIRFGWLDRAIDIDVLISAEQENINAKLLANPRILVLDHETALFDIITQHPYVERTISGELITETIKYKDVGTTLKVTPHVTRNDMLRLHIVPEFGVKVRDVALISGDVPVVDTRKVDTIALVQDNQTVVLGGLRKKEISQQINKVPLLGDLPILGGLFRFKGEDTVNSEIVVFITPHIIKRSVLSEDELKAYKETEFSRPKPITTDAEAEASKK
jgi:type IV pilus assembly protein PilQ